jgi:hypothetical protein
MGRPRGPAIALTTSAELNRRTNIVRGAGLPENRVKTRWFYPTKGPQVGDFLLLGGLRATSSRITYLLKYESFSSKNRPSLARGMTSIHG